jgi:hypothetical protein
VTVATRPYGSRVCQIERLRCNNIASGYVLARIYPSRLAEARSDERKREET